jgi:CheY-like chemotaxis protein
LTARSAICAAVQDTGIAIPAEAMDRLFASFGQFDASTALRFGGTGLGPAINSRLAEPRGGEVSVAGQVGRVSVFGFGILAAGAAPPQSHRTAVASRLQPGAGGPDRGRHQHQPPHPARGARELGRRPRRHRQPGRSVGGRFDAAILDVRMPNVDGIDLAGMIGAEPGGTVHDRSITLCSMADRDRLHRVGRGDLAVRPIKPNALRQR